MIKSRRKFTILFWTIFIVMFGLYSFIAGTIEKKNYIPVQGKVVNMVGVPEYYMYNGSIKTKMSMRPEITYPFAGSELSYIADKKNLAIGDEPTLLVSKLNPKEVRVYNFLFWLNYSVLIPAFLIACFIYSVAFITVSRYEKKPVILPGELDPFVYNEPERLKV